MSKKDESASDLVVSAVKILDPRGYIEGLLESARDNFRALLILLAYRGYGRVRATCGRRSLDSQMRLYGQGRGQGECLAAGVPAIYARPRLPVVTWCRPEDSKHVRGLALDVDFSMYRGVTWWTVGKAAEACGLTWGGTWKVKDYGHFEI